MAATFCDFIERLPADISSNVLSRIYDPKDLVLASSVSRHWRQFVIANGFSKKLFASIYPEARDFLLVSEDNQSTELALSNETICNGWGNLVKEHRVYSQLLKVLNSLPSSRNCISYSIAASSTDNFPAESIGNTLEANEIINGRPSYWSSSGQKDPSVPETLTYRLSSTLCIVDQINIRPFQAYFQDGYPIYSSKAVRFRVGHLLSDETFDGDTLVTGQDSATDDYFWTYVSPPFSMEQVNALQSFKLPKPVLCIGGIIQIELLGRVQKQESDGLYYICVCHIQVIGRPVTTTFSVEFMDNVRQFSLKNLPDAPAPGLHRRSHSDAGPSGQNDAESGRSSRLHSFLERLTSRGWDNVFVGTLTAGEESAGNDES